MVQIHTEIKGYESFCGTYKRVTCKAKTDNL